MYQKDLKSMTKLLNIIKQMLRESYLLLEALFLLCHFGEINV